MVQTGGEMKCFNKECSFYEEDRDDTNCRVLFRFEVEKCPQSILVEPIELVSSICEWEYDDDKKKTMSSIIHGYPTPANAVKKYKYCPYCSKTISIRG